MKFTEREQEIIIYALSRMMDDLSIMVCNHFEEIEAKKEFTEHDNLRYRFKQYTPS